MASSQDILIEFNAEENIGSVLSAIDGQTDSLLSKMEDGFENAANSVDNMNESLQDMENPELMVEVDDSEIDDSIERMEEMNDLLEEIYPEVDPSQIDDALDKKDGLNEDTQFTANVDDSAIENTASQVDSLLGAAASAGIAATASKMADTAGNIQDSWNRLDLTFGGVSDSMRKSISETAAATGRSGGTIRGYFNQMGIAGITNSQLLSDSFQALAGFAYQSGQDIESMQTKVQTMVLTGNAGTRMLKSLGLNAEELGKAMGVTGEEATKAFQALSQEERLQVLTKALGDGTQANEMYKNSWEGVKAKAQAELSGLMGAVGTPILQFLIPIMQQLTGVVNTISGVFKSLPAPIQTAVGGILAGVMGLTALSGVTPILISAVNSIRSGFNILTGVAGKVPSIASKFSQFGKQTKSVVDTASGAGGLAGKASAAGTGMKTTSVSLKGIGQGAMSMLAPLLEIAVVIAVLIPVITALAAEALLCLKGLQLLLDALDFDSIDLGPTIESIKQISQALIEVGVAMAAMTFTNIMTGAALLTSGITGIISPIQVAGTLLKQAGDELSKLGLANIDPSIADKIRKISESLGLVGNAMGDLTNLTLNLAMGNIVTLGGLLGNITTAITTAREEIVHAGQEISQIKNLPDIDQSAVDKLKKISESIKAVGDAFSSLRTIRDDANWDMFVQGLLPGMDIQTAINSIRNDLYNAGNSISQLTGLPDIPQDVADRLKKIADSIKSVGDALSALRSIRDDQNWDSFMNGLFGGSNISSVLNSVKSELTNAGNTLSSLTGLPDIPDGIPTKVNRIADSTKMVGNALSQMQGANIPDVITLALMPVKIAMARTVLQNIATQLNQLVSLPQIQEGISAKVSSVANTTRVVGSALTTMQGANIPDIASLMLLPIRIGMARAVLQNTATQLNQLQGIPLVPEGLAMKLNIVATGTRAVASAVSAINAIPYIGPEAGIKVGLAVQAVKRAMNELNQLQGGGVNVAGVVASVRNALIQVRGALAAMRVGFYASSVGLGRGISTGIRAGLTGLGGVVRGSVSSAMGSASGAAASGGRHLGSQATNGFRGTLKLGPIAQAEMQYAVQAINNGSGALAAAARRAAEQAVQAAKAGAEAHSPGAIARMWGQEIGVYSVQKIRDGSTALIRTSGEVARRVVNAWGSPNLITNTALNDNLSSPSFLNTVNGINTPTVNPNGNANTIIFNISEGAIPVDARNMTTTEAKQLLILALENLDMINNIDIRGIGA